MARNEQFVPLDFKKLYNAVDVKSIQKIIQDTSTLCYKAVMWKSLVYKYIWYVGQKWPKMLFFIINLIKSCLNLTIESNKDDK